MLSTERLLLRPAAPADRDALLVLWRLPGVRRYLWDDELISPARVVEEIERSGESFAARGFGIWLAFLREAEGGLAGFFGLRRVPPGGDEVELLFALDPSLWGRGLATEGAAAVLRHGFSRCGLERIVARTDPPNEASVRVMERLGMAPRANAASGLVEYELRARA